MTVAWTHGITYGPFSAVILSLFTFTDSLVNFESCNQHSSIQNEQNPLILFSHGLLQLFFKFQDPFDWFTDDNCYISNLDLLLRKNLEG